MSVDGFIAGINGEMDWLEFNWSEDIQQYVTELTQSVDTILLGRNLAESFIPHWANVAGDSSHPEQSAGMMFTQMPKIVFSHTLTESKWENTDVSNGAFQEKINALKQASGKDMIVYGGGKFVSSLIKENLIDELHLFINPALLGKGMPVFQEISSMRKLQLLHSQTFDCGIIALVYKTL